MKIPGIKIIAAFIFCVLLSCDTQDGNQDKQKKGNYNKKNNQQNQKASTDAAQVSRNSNDTCTSCCDPLLEIDPKLLVKDKDK